MELIKKRETFLNDHRFMGEVFFEVALCIYLIAEFVTGTTYIYVVDISVPYLICLFASCLAAVKILIFNRFNNLQEFTMIVMIGFFIWSCAINANSYNMIYYYVMIIAAKGVDFNKILRLFLIVISACLILTFVSAKLGIIAGLINLRDNSFEIRYALGTVYPTDLAARIFYLELGYLIMKKFKLSVPEYIIILTVILWAYIITDTRLDMLLMLMLLGCSAFRKIIFNAISYVGNTIISLAIVFSISCIIIMTYLYTSHNIVLRLFNKALSERLYYSKEAFTKYNVTFFGQWIPQEGNGGIHKTAFKYFYIDSSFIRILMMNGLFCFIIVLLLLLYLSRSFMENRQWELEIALIFVIISSIIDQHLMEISFNFFLLIVLADKKFIQPQENRQLYVDNYNLKRK